MARSNPTPRIWLAIYRRLVRLYPRSLRRDLGGEMESLFLDLHREARELGRTQAAWLAVRACAEVAPRAFEAHGDPDSPTGAYVVRSFFSDLRFAWRAASRQRRHTAVVVATIAIGVGATTAVFSVADAAILRPLPFPEAHRLVDVAQQHPAGWALFAHDADAYVAWGEQSQLFDYVGGYSTTITVSRIADEPREVDAVRLSPSLLPVLGAIPVAGRLLVDEDAETGAAPVALISERVWRRDFGGAAEAVGGMVTLDGQEHRVVGVLPRRFAFPWARTDVWLAFDPTQPGARARMVARVVDGLGLDGAREMAGILAAGFAEEAPRDGGWNLSLMTFDEQRILPKRRTGLLLTLAAASMLLLVAVVNVAQVALARAMARESELGVRAALGAGRGRIIRQVLLENVLLAFAGGALGVLVAYGLVAAIATAAPADFIRIESIQLGVDWRAIVAAGILSLGVGVGAGLAPAWSASRSSLTEALLGARQGLTAARGRRRLQSSLLVAEAALCLVLLAAAGLLMNSFGRLTSVDPGYDAETLATMILRLNGDRYATPESRLELLDSVANRVERLPGVERVAFAAGSPPLPGGVYFAESVETDLGDTVEIGAALPVAWVGAGYLETLGVDVLEGRSITLADYDTDHVVVGKNLAQRLFGDRPAVGRRFRLASVAGEDADDWWTIVGVVEAVATFGLQGKETSVPFYQPFKGGERPNAYVGLTVRTAGDPAALEHRLREALWSVDPDQPINEIALGTEQLADWVVEPRFNLLLVGTFASVALLLVLVGIGGVVGHVVASRTREIGIRVALGAGRRSVLTLATMSSLTPVAVGLGIGAVVVWQSTHLLSTLLYEIEPNDPATLAAVVLTFVLATLVASYLPARRALRVNPVRALRAE